MSRERASAAEFSSELYHFAPACQPRRAERRERRLSIHFPIVVSGFGIDGRLFQQVAQTFDVSQSGCRIYLRNEPQSGSVLTVRLIPRSAEAPTNHSFFEVEWSRPEEGGWLVGVSALEQKELWELAFGARSA